MKKTLSLLLAICMIFCICTPAFASDTEKSKLTADGNYPVIIIRGMEFSGLYVDYGTENEKNCIGKIDVGKIVGALVKALAVRTFTGSREKATGEILDCAYEILDGFSCNDDGSSKYNVGQPKYPGAVSQYEIFDTESINEYGITRTAKETFGGDRVYYFNYDWRLNPLDIADDINKTVNRAMSENNSEKVNILCASMGGVMTVAYLTKYGYEKVNRCVFASSTFCGTYATSDLLQGKVVINENYLYNYLLSLKDGTAYTVMIKALKYTGLIKLASKLANSFIEKNKDQLYDEIMEPIFGNMLTLWALVLPEDYDACLNYMFKRNGTDAAHEEFIKKADELQQMMKNRDAMLRKAQADGMDICVVAGYNSPVAPAYERSYVNGDGGLETALMSGNAAVVPLGETLKNYDENSKHLSPDRVCDTTTALFPDSTWLIKDGSHVSGSYGTDYAKFYMWLLSTDKPDVYGNSAYPAFMTSGKDQHLAQDW